MTTVFPDPPEGFAGTVRDGTGGKGTTGGLAGAVCAAGWSRGVPQYSQNFLLGATSFPQDVQNGI